MSTDLLVPPVPIRHAAGHALIAGRNTVRECGAPAMASALRDATSASGKATFTVWSGGQAATFGGTRESPGRGIESSMSVARYAEGHRAYARKVFPKGMGTCISLARSRHCGSSDAECVARTGIFLDADDMGSFEAFLLVLNDLRLAHIVQYRPGTGRWHAELFFGPHLAGPSDASSLLAYKHRYACEYGWVLGVLSELAMLRCDLQPVNGAVSVSKLGFDAATTRLIQLGNPYCKRTAGEPEPVTIAHDGYFIDWHRLLSTTGFHEWRSDAVSAEPLPSIASTVRYQVREHVRDRRNGSAWIEAAYASDIVIRELGRKVAIRCPWASRHSPGYGDTGTVIMPNGAFKCSHGSCGSRTQLEFFETLVPEAQALIVDAAIADAGQMEGAAFAPHVLRYAARLSVSDFARFDELYDDVKHVGEFSERWLYVVEKTRRGER
jgi:hypothetical protein